MKERTVGETFWVIEVDEPDIYRYTVTEIIEANTSSVSSNERQYLGKSDSGESKVFNEKDTYDTATQAFEYGVTKLIDRKRDEIEDIRRLRDDALRRKRDLSREVRNLIHMKREYKKRLRENKQE